DLRLAADDELQAEAERLRRAIERARARAERIREEAAVQRAETEQAEQQLEQESSQLEEALAARAAENAGLQADSCVRWSAARRLKAALQVHEDKQEQKAEPGRERRAPCAASAEEVRGE
ncbi:unnamed protein product, partial [Prorocentrum cordatum]